MFDLLFRRLFKRQTQMPRPTKTENPDLYDLQEEASRRFSKPWQKQRRIDFVRCNNGTDNYGRGRRSRGRRAA